MSIINNALKKVSDGRKENDQAVFKVSAPKSKRNLVMDPSSVQKTQKSFWKRGPWVLLGVVLLLVGATFFWMNERFRPALDAGLDVVQEVPEGIQGGIEFVPVATTTAPQPLVSFFTSDADIEPAARVPQVGSYELSGILWDETHPLALINGQVVEVGTVIDRAAVREIGSKYVALETSEGITILKIPQ